MEEIFSNISNNKKTKLYTFPLDLLGKICKKAGNSFPYIYLFDQQRHTDIIKAIQKKFFHDCQGPYDVLKFVLGDIILLEQMDFFKKSRYYATALLKLGEYDKYINILFYIKLYLYYLKIRIRNIVLREYILQYNEKYRRKEFILRINTSERETLLQQKEVDIESMEHTLYELILLDYINKKDIRVKGTTINIDSDMELSAIEFFTEGDNIEWIKKYWKYVEKTNIYQGMFMEKLKGKFYLTYLKYKREIDKILSKAYYIEDIHDDHEFIFNGMNKIKNIKIYTTGYTNKILREVDTILWNIGNLDLLNELYDLNHLYNIHYYKTLLNMNYYTINVFKSVTKKKLMKKQYKMEDPSHRKFKCPFRRNNQYYVSCRYEVPFTRLNSLYQENPDRYIVNYVNEMKNYIIEICTQLEKEINLKDINKEWSDLMNNSIINNDNDHLSSKKNSKKNYNNKSQRKFKIPSISYETNDYRIKLDKIMQRVFNTSKNEKSLNNDTTTTTTTTHTNNNNKIMLQ